MLSEFKELLEFEKGLHMLKQFTLKTIKNGGFFIWSILYSFLFFQTMEDLSRNSYTIYLVFGILLILISFSYCYIILPGQRRNFKNILIKFDNLNAALDSCHLSNDKKIISILQEYAKERKTPDRVLELEHALEVYRKYYWSWKELGIED